MTSTFDKISPVFGKKYGVSHVTAALTGDHPQLGARATVDGNEYIYVYNGGGEQISVGDVAIAMVGCTEFTCTVSSVSGDLPLGVCLHNTLTTDSYGWLLRKGYGTAYTSGAVAVAAGLMVDVDGGCVTSTSHLFARAMSAIASSTRTGPVFWQIP